MKGNKIKIFTALSLLVLTMTVGFQADDPAEINSRERLGEKLFFDPILSKDQSISCASCHKPEFAFADTSVVSLGVGGTKGARNTPTVTNLSGRSHLFWDGRSASLEEQALQPIINPVEMNLSAQEALERLNRSKLYVELFKKVFNSLPTEKNMLQAIAAYERTLETSNSPYDRYINGDDHAISPAAIRGRMLFIGKANCNTCHSGEDFTADRFKSIGLFNGKELNDAGRYEVTKNAEHIGEFKIPGLRNVGVTAPYMHNGMFKTLKEVINYYNAPDDVVKNGKNRDLALSKPLGLTKDEINDLEAFLLSLTDDRFLKK
ncbi:cytochrome-c peroxidase [Pedobacter sp.]|jgi:cytochrome c peroxidase|uniref:cytochrome-c peroxidase n=1 Tax=Pedobacter sp. TaxID=1411316 RepID=UPI002BCD4103|nr:cytochrome c peroxidase [Pedobacter sp.]HWW41878.1 cytochrome c peroxidase [Pedobacter sp.]